MNIIKTNLKDYISNVESMIGPFNFDFIMTGHEGYSILSSLNLVNDYKIIHVPAFDDHLLCAYTDDKGHPLWSYRMLFFKDDIVVAQINIIKE